MFPRRAWGGAGSGGSREQDLPDTADLAGWLAGRLPDGWYETAPEVTVDREEILVLGRITAPALSESDDSGQPNPAGPAGSRAAETGRIRRFREDTREQRMAIAREAEHRYGRSVAWGAQCGDASEVFTTLSVPVMTRLRQPERRVLDTLVEAGVARSRSDALGWCVRLVGQHQGEWIGQLRDALGAVQDARKAGPAV